LQPWVSLSIQRSSMQTDVCTHFCSCRQCWASKCRGL
jgi:hypothetical protein